MALLQTISGSTITVMTLTFSLTVVALQLASQQFSPRLLRDFSRDRVTKAVLATLVGTLVYATTVLRAVHAEKPLPQLALALAVCLGLAALASVLGFITHMTRVLRVDTMMQTVHQETDTAIKEFYPAYGDPRPRHPDELRCDEPHTTVVAADRSGFVQMIDVASLVRAAHHRDAVVSVDVRPGDHVVVGTPMARVWGPAHEGVPAAVRAAVRMGYERTIEQDAAFGFRQLTDIAVKALSPAVNDPVTAAHALGHMADLLVKLTGRRLGATLHVDATGQGRVVVRDRDLPYYLDLVCGPVRRYGRDEPTVLVALLRMLRDVATSVRDDEQRAHVARQAELIIAEMHDGSAHGAEQVHAMGRRVIQALDGLTGAAYRDRAGETRSV